MIITATSFAFLHSVEFYVIATVVAAGIVAFCLRPSGKGAAIVRTVTGWICEGDTDRDSETTGSRHYNDATDDGPQLQIECLRNGNVMIKRTDVRGVGDTGALTLQVIQSGFDLRVTEQLQPGRSSADTPPVQDAVFVLNFLAPEYYHIHWTTDIGDRFAAFTLHVRPGIKTSQPLKQ